LLREGSAEFFDDDDRGGAASSGSLSVGALGGEVVVDQDLLDGGAVVGGDLGGDAEVQHVTGVVLDDLQDTVAEVRGCCRRSHLECGGAGEDRPGDGGVEHAGADEAGVQGFVAGAAARYQGDLCGGGLGAGHVRGVGVQAKQRGMGEDEALERFRHDLGRVIDELSSAHFTFLFRRRSALDTFET